MEQVLIAFFANLPLMITAVAGLIASIAALRAAKRSEKAAKRSEEKIDENTVVTKQEAAEVKEVVNGRMDQLLKHAKAEGYHEGYLARKLEEDAVQKGPQPP